MSTVSEQTNIIDFPHSRNDTHSHAQNPPASLDAELSAIFDELDKTRDQFKEDIEKIKTENLQKEIDPYILRNNLSNEIEEQMNHIELMTKKIQFYLDEIEFFRGQ